MQSAIRCSQTPWAASIFTDTSSIDLDAGSEELTATVAATGAVDATLLLSLVVVEVEPLLLSARGNFARMPSHLAARAACCVSSRWRHDPFHEVVEEWNGECR